jgi:DNA-binding NtrC family response regulator
VRELQNSIERAVLLSDEETIGAHNLTLEGRAEGEATMPGDTLNLEELERGAIQRALRATHGVQKDAADLLGVTPRVLNYKIQILKIDWKVYRSGARGEGCLLAGNASGERRGTSGTGRQEMQEK